MIRKRDKVGGQLRRGRAYFRDTRTSLLCGGPDRDRVCSEGCAALYSQHLLQDSVAKGTVEIKGFLNMYVCVYELYVEFV